MKNDRSTWTDSVSRKLNCARAAQCLIHKKPSWCYLPIFDGFLFGFFHIVPIGFSIFWSFSRFLAIFASCQVIPPEERSSRGETWTVDDSWAMGEKPCPIAQRAWKHSEKETLFFFLRSTVYSDFGMVKLLRFSMDLTGHVSDESSEVQVGAPGVSKGLPFVCCIAALVILNIFHGWTPKVVPRELNTSTITCVRIW